MALVVQCVAQNAVLMFFVRIFKPLIDADVVCGTIYIKVIVQRFWNGSAVKSRELETLVLRELKFKINLFRDLAAVYYY